MSIPPMASVDPHDMGSGHRESDVGSAWTGWITFAGVIMVLLGIFHAIQGLVAIFKDEYYARRQVRPGRQRRLHDLGLGPSDRRNHCRGRRHVPLRRADLGASCRRDPRA